MARPHTSAAPTPGTGLSSAMAACVASPLRSRFSFSQPGRGVRSASLSHEAHPCLCDGFCRRATDRAPNEKEKTWFLKRKKSLAILITFTRHASRRASCGHLAAASAHRVHLCPPPFPGGGSARGRVPRLQPRKGGASHSLPGLGSWGPLQWGASRACPQRPLLLPGARPRLTAHVPSALGVWPSCSCWCSASASWWPASCTCTSPGSRCVRTCPVAAHTWTGVLVASARPLAG